jgi:hypothetical protein
MAKRLTCAECGGSTFVLSATSEIERGIACLEAVANGYSPRAAAVLMRWPPVVALCTECRTPMNVEATAYQEGAI